MKMGRAKLRMELITNEKARLRAFEKRKKGLEKAAYELSTLCGVDVGMIVHGPAPNNESNEPKIWSRNHEVVGRLIDSYRSRSGNDSKCRTYNLSAYFKDQTERIEDELKKLREKIREAKYPKWDNKDNCLSQDELREFISFLMAKINSVRERINLMKATRSSVQESMFLIPDIVQQQQPSAYYDTQDNMVNLMDGSRSLYLESKFLMNDSAYFIPDIVQQQPPLAYYDAQNNIGNQMMMMMMNNGASCSQGTYSFDESQNNHAYSFDGKWLQNCGLQTGIMENVGLKKVEPLMSHYVPGEETMPQNGQCLLLSSTFPKRQAHNSDGKWFQNCGLQTGIMENVGIRKAEPLMSHYVPGAEKTMPQNGQCLLLSSAFPQMQAAQEGDYVQRQLN